MRPCRGMGPTPTAGRHGHGGRVTVPAAARLPRHDPLSGNGWMLDRLGTAVWIYDIDRGSVVWANPAALEIWNADDLAELRARRMKDTTSPAVLRRLQQYQADFAARNAMFTELWTLYPHGVPRPMRVRFSGVRLDGDRTGMLCEGTAENGMEPEVMRSADALLHTQMMISLHRDDGRTLYLNPAARSAFDGRQERLAERFVQAEDHARMRDALARHRETRLTARFHTCEGIRWHEFTARTCLDPASGDPSVLVSATDVSNLKQAEALAQDMAHHDSMTGLPNRLMLSPIFDRLSAGARAAGAGLGVFFIDLDQFKSINDTLGHQHGDAFLMEVARRLSALRGPEDAVLRLGGDEFLFLATEAPDRPRLEALASEMLDRLSMPVGSSGRRLVVTPSIGLARFPDHGEDAQSLMRCADWAMYEAKTQGRNQYRLFQDRLRTRMEGQLEMLADLKEALARGQFDVHYQSRHSVAEERTVVVEALARWHHPVRGTVPASEFIPLCERAGLINPLGAFVLQRALCQQRRWQALGLDIAVSVNVSLRQLSDPGFGALVARLLAETGCQGDRIELELTETLLVEGNLTVHDNLEQVRALGMRIAIDDFGTGYSNLARLSDTDIDCIKIDRSLVFGLPRNAAIVETIIAMCRLMRVTIVAEGVETAEVAEWAGRHGCHELQGFHCGRPMPAEAMEALLLAQRGAAGRR
ncbi:putative bifunctional diguanylate cyclase/phosphodiesterase [Pseudoxanthomonas broegbernensis]|nr:bifunctional diguanylate cyclase/phosphodiesterase [Pseudoxanthomonas broegbernensis]MBB6065301.1 diguanylate cyclase (GGDEF)-like protein [Pseudoxanthomonas broegbernensis]